MDNILYKLSTYAFHELLRLAASWLMLPHRGTNKKSEDEKIFLRERPYYGNDLTLLTHLGELEGGGDGIAPIGANRETSETIPFFRVISQQITNIKRNTISVKVKSPTIVRYIAKHR